MTAATAQHDATGVATRRLAPSTAALLQLLPGVATLAVFLPVAAVFTSRGIPNLLALPVALLVAEVPVSWAIMISVTRRETGGTARPSAMFPWHQRIGVGRYLATGVPVAMFSVVMVGVVAPALGDPIRATLFSWVPEWAALVQDPSAFSDVPRGVFVAMWIASVIAFTMIGGPTQELYARGFLLPRTAHWGWWAPAFNALFFAVFHLMAPWSWPAFFLMSLVWAYLVWWQRSVQLGLVCHVGMLAIQSLGLTLLLLGVAPPPR